MLPLWLDLYNQQKEAILEVNLGLRKLQHWLLFSKPYNLLCPKNCAVNLGLFGFMKQRQIAAIQSVFWGATYDSMQYHVGTDTDFV